jgi:16S rRNA (uracil1498-N3)-methyltransferase
MRKIRLLVKEETLKIGSEIKIIDGDFNYLSKVMRQKIGDKIFVFNSFDGEFLAEIILIEKKFLILRILEKTADLLKNPNLTLAFALIKNVASDFIAKKGVEMGVKNFQPLITRRAIVDKINAEKFLANAKEGLEQCERNDLINLREVKNLKNFLNEKDENRIFILCDESGNGKKASEILPKINFQNKEIIVLIGPEGGFSCEEFQEMYLKENLFKISLGKNILKADTAMIAALALVNEFI